MYHILFIHSPLYEHWDGFHFLAIMNNGAMYTHSYTSLYVAIYFHFSWIETEELNCWSLGNLMFNILRNWQTVFQSCCTILHSLQQCLRGIHPEKTIIQKDICTPMFTETLFTIARSWNQPNCPSTDEWIKKMWYIYTMEYYSAIKRNEIGSFVETWMDLESVIQSEVRKRKTNIIY